MLQKYWEDVTGYQLCCYDKIKVAACAEVLELGNEISAVGF